jgi:hypothetical protein
MSASGCVVSALNKYDNKLFSLLYVKDANPTTPSRYSSGQAVANEGQLQSSLGEINLTASEGPVSVDMQNISPR